LRGLEVHHLNFKARPAGNYTRRQLSEAAAYTLFAHGEFESFLEDWATAITDRVVTRGYGAGFSPLLAHLIAYREKLAVPNDTGANNAWSTGCGAAVNAQKSTISRNHGIAEKYVCAMFIPLGVDVWSFDPILISDLNAFAKIRGDHAHQSRRAHLGQQFDPFDRMSKVKNIYSLLDPLDTALQVHLKAA
jgi:hypothetical protein